jgi:hypothetical protein
MIEAVVWILLTFNDYKNSAVTVVGHYKDRAACEATAKQIDLHFRFAASKCVESKMLIPFVTK